MKINVNAVKSKISTLNILYDKVTNINTKQTNSVEKIIANVEMGNFNSELKNFNSELEHNLLMIKNEIYNVANFLNNQLNQYTVISNEATNKVKNLSFSIASTYKKSINSTSNIDFNSINKSTKDTGYSAYIE